MEKKVKLMIGIIAVCAIGLIGYKVIQKKIRDSIMDGPGMVYEGIGLPDEVCGLWVSERTPQWSLRVSNDEMTLDFYSEPLCSMHVQNYKEFDEEGNLPEVYINSVQFDWPYSNARTAVVKEDSVSRDCIRLLVETDDNRRQTLWFTPAAEGVQVKRERDVLPEGVGLEGLKFHQSGSAEGIYCSIRAVPEGYEVRLSYDELYWTEMDGYESEQGNSRVSRVIVSGEEIQALMAQLMEYDVLSWDGFDRSESLEEEILDGDSGFDLKILLSDGQIIKAHGYNAFPPNSSTILSILANWFYSHEDYSAYYPDTFPECGATMLEILCPMYTAKNEEYFRIELYSSGRWAFSFQDPEGTFLDAGTNISEYGNAEDLPFGKYLALLKEYGFEAYNRTDCNDGDTKKYLSIKVMFEDGKGYTYCSNVYPKDYDAFRKELIPMMYADYLALKGQ